MATISLTLKLPFLKLNQCKAIEFERLTALNTDVANSLLEMPKEERSKYTSKDFRHIEIGSMWINQTIRNTLAATKVKCFRKLPLEVNNQGWKIILINGLVQIEDRIIFALLVCPMEWLNSGLLVRFVAIGASIKNKESHYKRPKNLRP